MSARDDILGKIRSATGTDRARGARLAAARARLSSPPRHATPMRASDKSVAELIALFRHYLCGQSATVIDVATATEVPAAIAAYLSNIGIDTRVRLGNDEILAALPWNSIPTLKVERGPARADDPVGISRAVAGIAETGTLMLLSGAENPVTLTFLPETHIAVLDTRDIVGSYEDAIAMLRRLTIKSGLPRTVNLVSGPSRTADISGILVMGAHGPRRLAVILVDGRS